MNPSWTAIVIDAWTYGRWNHCRAPSTVSQLAASRLGSTLAGQAPTRHVRAHVEFRESAEDGRRGKSPWSDVGHPEWHDAQPRLTVESVQVEAEGDERTQGIGFERPVREQEVEPAHPHHPRPGARSMAVITRYSRVARYGGRSCGSTRQPRPRLHVGGQHPMRQGPRGGQHPMRRTPRDAAESRIKMRSRVPRSPATHRAPRPTASTASLPLRRLELAGVGEGGRRRGAPARGHRLAVDADRVVDAHHDEVARVCPPQGRPHGGHLVEDLVGSDRPRGARRLRARGRPRRRCRPSRRAARPRRLRSSRTMISSNARAAMAPYSRWSSSRRSPGMPMTPIARPGRAGRRRRPIRPPSPSARPSSARRTRPAGACRRRCGSSR